LAAQDKVNQPAVVEEDSMTLALFYHQTKKTTA
jgi:hypothetical protein